MAKVSETKRISVLTKMSTADFNDLIPVDSDALTAEETAKAAEAANWWLAMDYRNEDDETVTDHGTVRFPISRLALLNESRVVPAVMLPSYVDEMVPGDMAYDDDTGKYTFTTSDETGYVYSCPDTLRTGDEREPRTDLIYVDDDSHTQYRYIASKQKFEPIPNTLALIDGNGTNVVTSTSAVDASRQIDIDIGAPAAKASGNANPLQISTGDNKQLFHAFSGVTAGTYGVSADHTEYDFGDSFTTHYIAVDSTGHVINSADHTIKFPETQATSTVDGLAMTGTSATHVGATSSAGTTGSNVYSAYDHVHAVSALYFGSASSLLNYKPSDTADKVITAKDMLNKLYGYTAGTTFRGVDASSLSVVATVPTLKVSTTGSGASEAYTLANSDIGALTNVYSFGHASDTVTMNFCSDNSSGSVIELVTSGITPSIAWGIAVPKTETTVDLKQFGMLELSQMVSTDWTDYIATQYIGSIGNPSQFHSNYSVLNMSSCKIGGDQSFDGKSVAFYAAPYMDENQQYTLPLSRPTTETQVLSAVADSKYYTEEGGYMPSSGNRMQLRWVELNDINPVEYVYMNEISTIASGTSTAKTNEFTQFALAGTDFEASNSYVSVSSSYIVLDKFTEGLYEVSVTVKITPGTVVSDKYFELSLFCDGCPEDTALVKIGGGVFDWTLKGPQYFTATAMVPLYGSNLEKFGFYWKLDEAIAQTGMQYGITNYFIKRVK